MTIKGVLAIYGLLAVLLMVVQRYRHTWWAADLLKSYGTRPTGPFNSTTRKDHLRGAVQSALAAVVCVALLALVGMVIGNYPVRSFIETTAQVYVFVFALLSAMAVCLTFASLLQAALVKTVPDVPYAVVLGDKVVAGVVAEYESPTEITGAIVMVRPRQARRALHRLQTDAPPSNVYLLGPGRTIARISRARPNQSPDRGGTITFHLEALPELHDVA